MRSPLLLTALLWGCSASSTSFTEEMNLVGSLPAGALLHSIWFDDTLFVAYSVRAESLEFRIARLTSASAREDLVRVGVGERLDVDSWSPGGPFLLTVRADPAVANSARYERVDSRGNRTTLATCTPSQLVSLGALSHLAIQNSSSCGLPCDGTMLVDTRDGSAPPRCVPHRFGASPRLHPTAAVLSWRDGDSLQWTALAEGSPVRQTTLGRSATTPLASAQGAWFRVTPEAPDAGSTLLALGDEGATAAAPDSPLWGRYPFLSLPGDGPDDVEILTSSAGGLVQLTFDLSTMRESRSFELAETDYSKRFLLKQSGRVAIALTRDEPERVAIVGQLVPE